MAAQQPSSDFPSSTERSSSDTVVESQTGAYIPDRDAVFRPRNDFIGSRTPTGSTGYAGFSFNRRILANRISNGDPHNEAGSHGINQAEPRVNGVSNNEESSNNDVADPTEQDRANEIRPRAEAKLFPFPNHAGINYGHAHSDENENARTARIPDGRQSFTVVLRIKFRDAQISYSRIFASMSSMTLTPDYNIGLHGDDFEHLYRFIATRFKDLVVTVDPADARRVTPSRRHPLRYRYNVEVDLSTGENPKRTRPTETFQNYGESTLAPDDAKFITAELEEIVLNAIETVDGLAAYRKTRRGSAGNDRHLIIPDFEAHRASEQERKYRWRVAMLELRIKNLMYGRSVPDIERDPPNRPF